MNMLKTDNEKVKKLIKLSLRIIEKRSGKEDILNSSEDIDNIQPIEVISIVEAVIDASNNMAEKKRNLSKILNVFHKGIGNYSWELSSGNLFLKDMMSENSYLKRELTELKNEIKGLNTEVKDANSKNKRVKELINKIIKLENIENHYVKKENILFPNIEKKAGHLGCLPVMWSIHDDVRNALKTIQKMKDKNRINFDDFYSMVGELFFSMYAMIFREELILYPAAVEIFEDEEWKNMYEESFDIGFSFINKKITLSRSEKKEKVPGTGLVNIESGVLDVEVLKLILNSLPLDITFVDEEDRVAYFSQPPERIFPRSKAIIGREVRNCHPPESVDKVNNIINSFRNGSSSKESFRIFYKKKYILIDYHAVRDREGRYKGTLEVTTDITEINQLTSEKRL